MAVGHNPEDLIRTTGPSRPRFLRNDLGRVPPPDFKVLDHEVAVVSVCDGGREKAAEEEVPKPGNGVREW